MEREEQMRDNEFQESKMKAFKDQAAKQRDKIRGLKNVEVEKQNQALEQLQDQMPEDEPALSKKSAPLTAENLEKHQAEKSSKALSVASSKKPAKKGREKPAWAQTEKQLEEAKEAEIVAGQAQLDKKTQEIADAEANLAQAKEDIEDTRSSLAADEQFLMMLKEKCSMTDQEWEQRQKTRQEEMEAVSKALAILSGDDAHDLFTRTFTPALLQKDSADKSSRRDRAAKLLSAVAARLHNPRMATLAYQVGLDAFARVKKAIDNMIAQLLKEKEDEANTRIFALASSTRTSCRQRKRHIRRVTLR